MNLFATSVWPDRSARYLDDARVIKACLETAQLVSLALADAGLPAPYRPTHARHPVSLWVLADGRNFLWALDHLEALALEHRRRFPTSAWHASYLAHLHVIEACRGLPRGMPAAFQNSARNASLGLDFTRRPGWDVAHAYRSYLVARWNMASLAERPPRWTSSGAPWWLFGDGRATPFRVRTEATDGHRRPPYRA